jgi:hypothetical protein
MPIPIALGLAAAQGIYQGIKGIRQKNQAKKLKESTYIPEELLMNRDLAQQQAFSRRAPGQSNAEENTRRNLANRISAAQKSFGGDANKMAAVTSAATGQANDANARLAAQGQQFSEGAFNRLSNANIGVAAQKRQNRSEYMQTKNALQASGDQNIFSGIGNLASAGIAGIESGAFDGIGSETKTMANNRISMGKMQQKFGANQATIDQGKEWVKQGKGMKKSARQALSKGQRGGWNDYLNQSRGGQVYDRYGNPVGYNSQRVTID